MEDSKDALVTSKLLIGPARQKGPGQDERVFIDSGEQVAFLASHTGDQLGHSRYQILAAFLACTSLISAGLNFSWSASALVQLKDENSGNTIKEGEVAWIVSALQIGACLGNLLTVVLLKHLGRRTTHLISAVPYLLGWTLVYKSRSFACLFAGRIVSGMAIGANFTVLPIYLGEIAENRLRGAMVSFMTLLSTSGILSALVLGPWVSKEAVAIMGFSTTVFFASTFFWMPETPYYYLSRNQTRSAEKSLSWLRGTDKIQVELQEMKKFQDLGKALRGNLLELVTVPGNRKASLILIVTFAAQQLSGFAIMIGYVGVMLYESPMRMDPKLAMVFAGCLTFTMNSIAFFLADRLGRKKLILLSSFGTTLALFIIATYFHLLRQTSPSNSHQVSWLIVAGIFGFYLFHSVGLESIPCGLVSETYPTSAKPYASMVAAIYGSLLGICTTNVYQVIVTKFDSQVFFFGCGCLQSVLFVVMVLILPETKGQSFRTIQNTLARK